MRRVDDNPIDPEIAAELEAIDATLAGEPVDPRHAELAELALLLVAERPQPGPEFARSLDERVQWRFAAPALEPRPSKLRSRGWFAPLAVLSTGVAAIVAVVVLLGSGGGGSPSGLRASASGAGTSTSAASSAPSSPAQRASRAHSLSSQPAGTAAGAGAPSSSSAGALFTPAPQPPPNGRKIIQSAQLALTTRASHIDDVAQEVFRVVGQENGIVNSSQVTASASGYAQFQLSVPSSALGATMTSLSELRYASVSARTDATQDVNGQYLSDQRRLADDRALRTSLLKQLAGAITQEQVDSLTAQIHDAESSIRSDEATLSRLGHEIDFSQITVTINAVPAVIAHGSSGFTLGKAAHDAGRVLTVAAGVALISLAALTPVALILALAWWIAAAVRRRRREQALDLA